MFFLVLTLVIQRAGAAEVRQVELGPFASREGCSIAATSPQINLMGGRVMDVQCVSRQDI